MTILGIGCLMCAFWLPDKHATLTHSRSHEREPVADDGLAVAVAEF